LATRRHDDTATRRRSRSRKRREGGEKRVAWVFGAFRSVVASISIAAVPVPDDEGSSVERQKRPEHRGLFPRNAAVQERQIEEGQGDR
jgi:hypothetical protein